MLEDYLAAHGFAVRGAADAAALDGLLVREPADLLILDVNMPGEDGFAVLRRRFCQRSRQQVSPVLG